MSNMKSPNTFMNVISEKNSKGIFKKLAHKIKLRKFRKTILEGSPSFGLLWKMADFIKIAEIVFFYNNTHALDSEFAIYSSNEYMAGTNGFKLKDDSTGVILIVKLISDTQKVIVDIERHRGNKLKNTMTFVENQWQNVNYTAYDEMLLEQIIKIINSKIIALFDHCYELR